MNIPDLNFLFFLFPKRKTYLTNKMNPLQSWRISRFSMSRAMHTYFQRVLKPWDFTWLRRVMEQSLYGIRLVCQIHRNQLYSTYVVQISIGLIPFHSRIVLLRTKMSGTSLKGLSIHKQLYTINAIFCNSLSVRINYCDVK